MSTSIYEVLDELDGRRPRRPTKGSKLERLMAQFLRTDRSTPSSSATCALQDWPDRGGKHDTGIDIVAGGPPDGRQRGDPVHSSTRTRRSPNPTSTLFLSASGKEGSPADHRLDDGQVERPCRGRDPGPAGPRPAHRASRTSRPRRSTGTPSTGPRPKHYPSPTRRSSARTNAKPLRDVCRGLATADRGKLIMACGTGKTFTSLRLAEQLVGAGGSVLFLVPSISLLSQTLREGPPRPRCPSRPSRSARIARPPLAQGHQRGHFCRRPRPPSTTNVAVLESPMDPGSRRDRLDDRRLRDLPVHRRRRPGPSQGDLPAFDLIVCDEAHRTTGTTLAGENEVRLRADPRQFPASAATSGST